MSHLLISTLIHQINLKPSFLMWHFGPCMVKIIICDEEKPNTETPKSKEYTKVRPSYT